MTINNTFLSIVVAVLMSAAVTLPASAQGKAPKMTKQERVALRNGNKLYKEKRYAEAEVEYKKALQANPNSEKAQFNLATTYMRQGNGTASKDDKNSPMNQAEGILTSLAKNAQDKQLRGKASYDLGNIAYSRQDYGKAVDYYKQALRCDPNDDQARQNLRLAQLKQKQQQDQNQNKDQNKDQDKNQDQNKDQNKDQNQNQDQNKDQQNKDQNQDQNKDQNQNKDQQNQDKQDQQRNQQQQGGMSQQNAEQVLKAMQDREHATQQRINAQQAQQQRHERQRTNKKW